jgi:membrane-associated phospholipid phosphatase
MWLVPTCCAINVTRAWGPRIGGLVSIYAGAVGLAVVYLGEHYLVDVVAGIALAGAADYLSKYFGAWASYQNARWRQSPLALPVSSPLSCLQDSGDLRSGSRR